MLFDELPVFDPAAPGACLLLLRFDKRLEAVEVSSCSALDVAGAARELLEHPAWVDVEAQ